ncbi:MAG: hypothetical protein PHI49_00825 [Halothiobacillaceae bacterium]|jgi:hypothetical protein|nr:hypothetical protein [Halothiobacillaceae bacterium]MDY0050195.1 hypothetical protein [Halothiobacillaceae bacterium]
MSSMALHPSIRALSALAAAVAARCPSEAARRIRELNALGVAQAQIDDVLALAREVRDTASARFDSVLAGGGSCCSDKCVNEDEVREKPAASSCCGGGVTSTASTCC